MFKVEWQVFCFLKGQIPQFTAIVISIVFWDFYAMPFKNVMSESAEISRVDLPQTTSTDKLLSFW